MRRDLFLRELIITEPDADIFPFTLPVLRGTRSIAFESDVTFFVGENGTGKSTVLEGLALALGLNPEGGSANFTFSTADTHSALHRHIRLVRGARRPRTGYFLRAESFYNLATNIDELAAEDRQMLNAYGGTSLHEQSHGESFMSLFLHRFSGAGLYLMDEPEAALSPLRQLAVLRLMHDLAGRGAQFIIATHSPILLGYPDARLLSFDRGRVTPIAYEDTEHYVICRRFLLDHKTYLAQLFREDE